MPLAQEALRYPNPLTCRSRNNFDRMSPIRHLQSHYQLHVASHTHRTLLASAAAPDAIRIRSAGGHTAGTSLTSPLQYGGVHYTDSAFKSLIRWRLGIEYHLNGFCMNWNASREEHCGHALLHDHAVLCPCGPARNRRQKTF